MTEVCKVPLFVEKFYQDDFICDVLQKDAYHMLSGRPYHFDKDVIYKGKKNT